MPNSVVPVGLNYVNVRRRAGVLSDYNMVFRNTMALSDFYLIDDFVQVEIKNFGQISNQKQSEVYIVKLLADKAVYDDCNDFDIVPISIDGVDYNGKAIQILFEDIVAMTPTDDGFCKIYACTNPIKKQIPVIYLVGYNVDELWEYILTCAFPSI